MVVLNKAFCYTLQQLLYLHSMPSVEILKGSFHFFLKCIICRTLEFHIRMVTQKQQIRNHCISLKYDHDFSFKLHLSINIEY